MTNTGTLNQIYNTKSQIRFLSIKSGKGDTIVRNANISHPTIRVVYNDKATNTSKWEIMSREDALQFAKKLELDLILVDDGAEPPVCKLDNYGQIIKAMKAKRKELRINEKARTIKELYFTAGISLHDLNIKLDKAKEFLSDGHPVKVTVTIKKDSYKIEPTAIDQTIYTILNLLEKDVLNVRQSPSKSALRREFTLNPKPKVT